MFAESIPRSATPRRMNGRTVVASSAPLALPDEATAAPTRSVRNTYGSVAAPTVSTAPAQRAESSGRPGRRDLVAGEEPGRAEVAQPVRAPRACRSRPRPRGRAPPGSRRPRIPRRPTHPSRAPARRPGAGPRSSRAATLIAAVNPAVPIAIASRCRQPVRQRHDPAGRHPRDLRVPAMARGADVVAVGEHGSSRAGTRRPPRPARARRGRCPGPAGSCGRPCRPRARRARP